MMDGHDASDRILPTWMAIPTADRDRLARVARSPQFAAACATAKLLFDRRELGVT